MTDETNAPDGGLDAAPVIAPANLDSTDTYSPEQALEAYQKRTNPPAESADTATADTKSADEADAAPPEEAPSEVTEDAEPAEEPLIERPRSWTKDVDDVWQSLPRPLQEKVAAREQEREREIRRSQNEAAEKLKSLTAKEQEAEQVRQKYEAKLPLLEKKLQTVGPFADIQSMNDLKKLQEEDPFRFQQYQLYVWEQQAEQSELKEVEARKTHERQSKRSVYEAEQNKLLIELVPEMADPTKANSLRERAVAMLVDDLGLKNEQLSRWMQDDVGHEILSNAGIQKLIADRLTFQDIKAAPPKAMPKPVPAVQRPGVAPPKGAAATENVQALRNKLSGSGSVDDAFALYQAKQRRATS